MPRKQSRKLCKKAIQSFIDVLVLPKIGREPMSGYDVIQTINDQFGVVLSPSVVYGSLYSMEREGLLKASLRGRARTYELTKKGAENLPFMSKANEELEDFITNIASLPE
ncbi:MAG: PadR family transcriptional regulator [Candidatus Bathyarchaeota archaeon]|nr:MAG: PadR family transcriptional regulator [Candidatus Bathyarchaeota archaeon]